MKPIVSRGYTQGSRATKNIYDTRMEFQLGNFIGPNQFQLGNDWVL